MLVHPVIAESYATALDAPAAGDSLGGDLPAAALDGFDLLQRFAGVSDGRSGQGRDHPVAVVLTLCAAAVLAGMRSFTAIAGWVADVPAELLAPLYGRPCECSPTTAFPSKTTLWRVLTGADAAAVDAAVGAWLTAQAATRQATADHSLHERPAETGLVALAVDGKTVRGAIDSEGNQTHLLAAATHGEQLVLSQVEVGAKSNEIPQFAPLLDGLTAAGVDLRGLVITAALHTQRGHAEYLHQVGAEFVLTAKGNQPRLFAALDALPWATTPIAARDIDRSHGRVTTRTIQVLPTPPDLPFPHVNQVWLIERYVTDTDGTPHSAVAALGVTSLTTTRATPTDIAALVREHWGIESLHWLRDTVYREDNSTARTGSGPRVMAALPRHRRPAPARPTRHHRSHPLGHPRHGPTIQDPQANPNLSRSWNDRGYGGGRLRAWHTGTTSTTFCRSDDPKRLVARSFQRSSNAMAAATFPSSHSTTTISTQILTSHPLSVARDTSCPMAALKRAASGMPSTTALVRVQRSCQWAAIEVLARRGGDG